MTTKERTSTGGSREWNGGDKMPFCQAGLERRLTKQDRHQGHTACQKCRLASIDPPMSNKPKGTRLESWWVVNLSRSEEIAWRARAAQEIDRMCGSREFKFLGYRRSLEEIGGRMRDVQ